MALNKTENLVSLLQPGASKRPDRVLGQLKCLQDFFHFHQGTEFYSDIGSMLEDTIRYFTDG